MWHCGESGQANRVKTFKLSVTSPLKKLFESDSVASLIVPAYGGKLGIMADHAELFCSIKKGEILIKDSAGSPTSIPVSKGLLSCSKNNVVVLVQRA